MKKAKSRFKSEAKRAAAPPYGVPALGLSGPLVLLFVRLLRAGG